MANPARGFVSSISCTPASVGVPADFRAAVADFERQVLRRALERAQFKQTVAAKILGLSYHQFRSLLRKHGLAKQGLDSGD